jgi:hypothetical protein
VLLNAKFLSVRAAKYQELRVQHTSTLMLCVQALLGARSKGKMLPNVAREERFPAQRPKPSTFMVMSPRVKRWFTERQAFWARALGPRSRCGSLPSLYGYHQVDGRFVPKLKNRLIFR